MSIPRDKIDKLVKELEQLDEKDAEQAVIVIEDFIRKKKNIKRTKPSDYRGALKHLNFSAEEESKKIRDEWKREWE
ncbi:MAG: hypothetical protein A2Y25_06660 [Candidatus Melainabacteria bacterium GWF2_37_15]|nr:MAG: hypothetical protein A2Y25_06660 [Candidatus Melainabacteria bacterium GWF2_37_15]